MADKESVTLSTILFFLKLCKPVLDFLVIVNNSAVISPSISEEASMKSAVARLLAIGISYTADSHQSFNIRVMRLTSSGSQKKITMSMAPSTIREPFGDLH